MERVAIERATEKGPENPIAEDFYSHSASNYGETTYSHYINALVKIKDANNYLVEQTQGTSGRTRYCILIARANRGDASVKKEIINIFGDKDAGMFRAWAAGCLGKIGTQDDIPLLEIIAESDLLERDPHYSMDTGPILPVRMAAKEAIRDIEKKYQEEN